MTNWNQSPLSEVLETLENGSRPKGGVGQIESGIPSIGGEHITNSGTFDFTELRYIPQDFYGSLRHGKIRVHDILLVKDGATTGKVALVTEEFPFKDAAVNEHVFIVRPRKDQILSDYLFYFMYSPYGQTQIRKSFHGAAQGGINTQFAKDFIVPTPPIEIQRKIATILRRANQLKQKREQANQLANKIIQSVFLKVFGDPVANPRGWGAEKLVKLSVRITKGESPKWQGFEYVSEGPLFIRSENVQWGHLDLSKQTRITLDFHQKLSRSQLRPKDVLINLVGASIGRAAMVPATITEANVNQAVGVITLGSVIMPEYLVQFLISPSVQRVIHGGKVEAARANISLGDLRELDVPVPSTELQEKFAEFVHKLGSVQQRQDESAKEINELFHSLMHRAFSGELTHNVGENTVEQKDTRTLDNFFDDANKKG